MPKKAVTTGTQIMRRAKIKIASSVLVPYCFRIGRAGILQKYKCDSSAKQQITENYRRQVKLHVCMRTTSRSADLALATIARDHMINDIIIIQKWRCCDCTLRQLAHAHGKKETKIIQKQFEHNEGISLREQLNLSSITM